jgi:hypothetical protein
MEFVDRAPPLQFCAAAKVKMPIARLFRHG